MTDIRIIKTRQAIEMAMSDLLKEKTFDQITTTELVKRAGISRSSFYTHYQDKYEMIDQYQSVFFTKVETIFDQNGTDVRNAIFEIFDFLYQESVLSALLSENGTREIHIYLRQKLKTLLTTVIPPHLAPKKMDQVRMTIKPLILPMPFSGWFSCGSNEGKKKVRKKLRTL